MTDESAALAGLLAAALAGIPGAGKSTVQNLTRLSGGANMETWAFDWHSGEQTLALILRRLPPGAADASAAAVQVGSIDLATEAAVLRQAAAHGVSVPTVLLVLNEEHGLGSGYIMSRERGEALPFRILADDKYAVARRGLAYQCGEALGKIHSIPLAALPPGLRNLGMDQDLDRLQGLLDAYGNTSAVHQLALNWLRDNAPAGGARCLVHGDFRNGNLLVDEQGLVAVLDWELTHIGYPAEDLGYICGNVWRFGRSDKPVGGFGDYEQLLAGYRSVRGEAPTVRELRYWEVYCALNWGLVCLTMIHMYRSGQDRSLERAAVGRRLSESEVDLLLLLEELGV
jgi:aminoglycoside phosphotransferase (APT) family kinase protein